ncbi:hypothetical protein GCM10022239_03830 [Leifsonia bigeumensis]|uniref:Uncharacterized protein n=2 Tax=Leifsonella bigeumensis TaxID=433643 RepID=A0ABP7F419_9MICO
MLVAEWVEHKECDETFTRNYLLSSGENFSWSGPCGFAGDVDVMGDHETATAFWSCPRCGAEHDVSREVFP